MVERIVFVEEPRLFGKENRKVKIFAPIIPKISLVKFNQKLRIEFRSVIQQEKR